MNKTPTPILYNEHLVVNGILIDGAMIQTNDDGSVTPEVGAYVYIYVNNIIINEDLRAYSATEGRAGVVTVTDSNGYWSYQSKPLPYGSIVVVKAQSPGKIMSDFSVPCRVGGTPTPKNIVSMKSDGTYGPPRKGDTLIEGEFEGLKDRTASNAYVYPYTSNLDLYPYIDGVKQDALLYNQIIGRNFLEDFLFFGSSFCLNLLVQGNAVDVCIDSAAQFIYEETFTGLTTNYFTIHPPTDNAYLLRVYCGGLRLAQNNSTNLYDFYVSSLATGETTINLSPEFVVETTDIFCVQYITVDPAYITSYVSLVYQNTLDEAFTIPYTTNYQVYKNGLRMLEGVSNDYVVTTVGGNSNTVITFNRVSGNSIIRTTDTIIIDYKLADTSSIFYGTKEQTGAYINPVIEESFVTPKPGSGVLSFPILNFYLYLEKGFLAAPTFFVIYKDGIRQQIKKNGIGDYTVEAVAGGYFRAVFDFKRLLNNDEPAFSYTTSLDINNNTVYTATNNFVVEFVYSLSSKTALMAALNSLPAMVDNKITAKIENYPDSSYTYLVLESPYTLDFVSTDIGSTNYFSKYPSLSPGKDEQGRFKYFIDFRQNKWRYTFKTPLKKLRHITAATFPRG
jgi:hypothetical protein